MLEYNYSDADKNRITTLTFDFNEEAVKKAGFTTDELLEDMRTYAKECEIDEIAYGVFEKKGIHGLAMLVGYVVRKNDAEPEFINYLNSWLADVGGDIEDCKISILKKREREKLKGE